MRKFVKLTHVDGRTTHINADHIYMVGVHSDGQVVVGYGPGDNLMPIKETPEEVMRLLEEN